MVGEGGKVSGRLEAGRDVPAAGAADRRPGEDCRPAGECRPAGLLARLISGAGWLAAGLFVLVGVAAGLQAYGDGAVFSYAVAAGEGWAFHWHNIPVRTFVWLVAMLPAELYARGSGDGTGAVALYGFLFFSAQAVGLLLTLRLDRSPERTFFYAAALSTAVLCPLVFGFPTEMWFAHAAFWPTMAACHRGANQERLPTWGLVLLFGALVLSHEGGVVLAMAILVTLALRGPADSGLKLALGAFGVAMAAWGVIRLSLRPDDYFDDALEAAAFGFIDPANLASRIVVVILAAMAGFMVVRGIVRRLLSNAADIVAVAAVVVALAVYWGLAMPPVHAEDRYHVRTVLLIGVPVLGGLAALLVVELEGRLWRDLARGLPARWLASVAGMLRASPPRAAAGLLALVVIVHGVETVRFVAGWGAYKAAVRQLATVELHNAGEESQSVSAGRLPAAVRALDWESTTPFVSVLVAPSFKPQRLVVAPQPAYIWLSCAQARLHAAGAGAMPAEARAMVARHACLNRP